MDINDMRTLCSRLEKAIANRQEVRVSGSRHPVDAVFGPYHGKIMVRCGASTQSFHTTAFTIDGQPAWGDHA